MTRALRTPDWMKTAIVSLAVTAFGSSVAQAQFAPNSKAPINGSADNADYRADMTVLTGQVDVRQGDVRILSDVMKIHSARSGGASQGGAFDNVSKIEAIGNFYYITPEQEVRGNQGVYQQATDTFTVTGDVILLQGEENVVTGDTLIYNLTTNQAKVIGSCKGRRCGSTGRVNILIKNTDNSSNAS